MRRLKSHRGEEPPKACEALHLRIEAHVCSTNSAVGVVYDLLGGVPGAASIFESAEIPDVFENARPDIWVISSSPKDGGSRWLSRCRGTSRQFPLGQINHASRPFRRKPRRRSVPLRGLRCFSRDDSFELLARCVQKFAKAGLGPRVSRSNSPWKRSPAPYPRRSLMPKASIS